MNPAHQPRVLLTGASGFIGGRLLTALVAEGVMVRCLVRSPWKLPKEILRHPNIEIVQGDLLQPETLPKALESMHAAYYLVHSMGEGTRDFVDRDREAARNFVEASDEAGLERILYLGGLTGRRQTLSRHLASREEVAHILRSGHAALTEFRAAIIIGAGSAPFEMLRYLVERLPFMICPQWVYTKSQPIAVQNVVDYLIGSLKEPATGGLVLDIGGPDILSYFDLMRIYARIRHLHRFIFTVPLLTPRLSSYWVDLVTPVPSGIVRSLIAGLKNEAIVKDDRIRSLIPSRLIGMEEAICTALAESREGPGQVHSVQACLSPKRYHEAWE